MRRCGPSKLLCPANPGTAICAIGRGFTLLELAVVMFLIGLVMTIAMPYFGSLRTSQMRSEARRLASRANYLYQEAGAQKVILRLNFDFANNGYFVTRLDPFAAKPAFQTENGPAGVRVVMPTGIRIRDVTVEGQGTRAQGVASSQFYPGGSVDATLIHLVDERGEVFTLGIDPFSGHVAIEQGDIRPGRASGLIVSLGTIATAASGITASRERMMWRSRRAFTFLEVMIAVAFIGIAMLALMSLHRSDLDSVIRAQDLTRAAMLAQQVMSTAEVERFPLPGQTRGDFAHEYRRRVREFPLGTRSRCDVGLSRHAPRARHHFLWARIRPPVQPFRIHAQPESAADCPINPTRIIRRSAGPGRSSDAHASPSISGSAPAALP